MTSIKRYLSFCAIALGLTIIPHNISAATSENGDSNLYENNTGYAYEGTHRAPNISPKLALGAVVVVGIIALVVVNNDHHSHHSHSHS